ncbi:aminopeptidase P family protein [Thermoleophilia bacterium SCSIO 60948]|nr:aminopeptidase P family protein [Thermoleophilia bacterium SCSIO 60948]
MSTRLDRLRAALAERELDALIVGDLVRPGDSGPDAGANVRWLTGFDGTSSLILAATDRALFVTDFRYTERAERVVPGEFERVLAEKGLIDTLAPRLSGRVGFDEAATSVRSHRKLAESAPDDAELVPVSGVVEALRRTKDEAEQKAMAAAAKLADDLLAWLIEQGFAGRSELEIAVALEGRMREHGAEPSFPTIVASGENSALPHHSPSERIVAPGDLLTIDWGVVLDGYCSDGTRTFSVGAPSEDQREIYELVLRAQEAGLGAVRAGVSGREVDAVSRRIIEAGGHGEHFGHGLGHGVGLEIHEAPRLSTRSEDELIPGDVVTVEPGVYVPGRFGVRIEDIVIVTDDGYRNLSSLGKELIEVE